MDVIFNWLSANIIEVAATVLGISYVLLAIKQNIWCWLLGIVSVALYIIIFFTERLYGDAALQLFYLFFGFYGWYHWYFGSAKPNSLPVTSIPKKTAWVLAVAIALSSFVFGYVLSFTDSDIPYWDGFTTALGLAATWMTARKYLENWLLWIFANAVCVGVYYYKGLYPTVFYYIILALLAYRGYTIWKKDIKTTKDG